MECTGPGAARRETLRGMTRRAHVLLVLAALSVLACDRGSAPAATRHASEVVGHFALPDSAWRKRLAPESYNVLRHAGTETAFTGRYWNEHRKGIYRCAGCDLTLFSSAAKFESGTGWPSFRQPIAPDHVTNGPDASIDGYRVDIRCARCGGHLGHVFKDGPPPTGLRYCMNSAALAFTPAK